MSVPSGTQVVQIKFQEDLISNYESRRMTIVVISIVVTEYKTQFKWNEQ